MFKYPPVPPPTVAQYGAGSRVTGLNQVVDSYINSSDFPNRAKLLLQSEQVQSSPEKHRLPLVSEQRNGVIESKQMVLQSCESPSNVHPATLHSANMDPQELLYKPVPKVNFNKE